MAVYVVLGFDDEREAKRFVHTSLYGTVAGIPRDNAHDDPEDYPDAKVYGVYKKPTKYCDTSDGHRGGGKLAAAWTRGIKYGWWVCSKCGKPSQLATKMGNWFLALGVNLLPAELHPEPQYVPAPQLGSAEQWNFLLPQKVDDVTT